MKKTKVICSIGPSCMNENVLQQMVLNGMDCARINLSHVKREEIDDIINLIRVVRVNTGVPLAIMYDTRGSEFRTLEFVNNGISIKAGETIMMVKKNVVGNKNAAVFIRRLRPRRTNLFRICQRLHRALRLPDG